MIKNVTVVGGQIVYPSMNTKMSEEKYAKTKAHMWLFMLNEGKKPKKWLKANRNGTKVNFDMIQTQEDYDEGLKELDVYLQEINKDFGLDYKIRKEE